MTKELNMMARLLVRDAVVGLFAAALFVVCVVGACSACNDLVDYARSP